jgi:hypothetical protein
MNVNLSIEQLERIIEALRKSHMTKKDTYLANYLETVKKNQVPTQELDLDEIPF